MSSTVLPVADNEKPQSGRTPDWGFSVMRSLLPPRDTKWSLQRPLSRLQLQGKPGGERLHAVTFNIVTIPHRKGDRHRHSRLKLGIVGITRFQRALHHYAPGWTSVSTTLNGTRGLPHTVSDDILMSLRREGTETIGIQILNRAHAQRRIGHDVARPDPRIEGPKASADPVRIGHPACRLFEIIVPENAGVLVVHIPNTRAILAEILLPLCIPPPDVGGAA